MATIRLVRFDGSFDENAKLPVSAFAVVRRADCGLHETFAADSIEGAMELAMPESPDEMWYSVYVEAYDAGAARLVKVPTHAWREVHPDIMKRVCGVFPTCSICLGYHGPEVQHACE